MAIKIQGTTVIDDSRNATALTNLSFDSITLNGTTVVANADELNRLQGVTDPIDSQLGALAKDRGTLNKTFTSGETAAISLTSAFPSDEVPVLSVTKEVPQTGVTSNDWDVASDGANYTLHDTAYDTTLTPTTIGFQDIGNISYDNSSLSVSTEETNPYAMAFNNDGTKLYVTGGASDSVHQYTMSSAFDISTASYDNLNFSFSSQEQTPFALAFSVDGTQMFMGGLGSALVYEYSLSSAFDISTATYNSIEFDASAQTSDVTDLTFSVDGNKMYILSGNTAFQYTLSVAFDITTASYDGTSFDFSGQDTAVNTLVFDASGSKAYANGDSSNNIYEYELSNEFDLATASYSGNSFNYSNQDGSGYGVLFNETGTKMYILGADGDSVYQYTVPSSESLLLGTGSFASTDVGKRIVGNGGEAILTAADGSYELQTAFNDDSTIAAGDWSMFALDVESAAAGLTLSGIQVVNSVFDIENAIYDSVSFSVFNQDKNPQGVEFNTDGTKMYIVGTDSTISSGARLLLQYSLSEPFDLNTASYNSVSFDPTGQEQFPKGVAFNNNGTKMYIIGSDTSSIYQYTLGTAFDVSSASYDSVSYSISAQDNNPSSINFNDDGTKMYVSGEASNQIHSYSLSTAFDLSTASYDNVSFSSGEFIVPLDIDFNNDGTKLYVLGYDNQNVYQYSLSTAFDISTATYDAVSFVVSGQGGSVRGISFNTSGTKMYTVDNSSDTVNQYSTADISNFIPTSANHTAITTASIDSEFWIDINSMTADDSVNDGAVYYAVSTDDRTTWSIIDDTDGVRNIVRDNAGTWEVNDASDYGTETWVAATENDEFYALEEAVDVSTAQSVEGFAPVDQWSYDNVSFDVSGQESNVLDVAFNNDGTKMYIVGESNVGSSEVNQYSLSTPYLINTASYDNVSFDVSPQDAASYGISFNDDGSKMFILGDANDSVFEYNLSTNYEIGTASYNSVSFNVSGQTGIQVKDLAFNSNGSKMFVMDSDGLLVEYDLSTSFDVSTSSYSGITLDVSSTATGTTGFAFNTSGDKLYIGSTTTEKIHQYSLSTPFNLSTASYDNSTFDITIQGSGTQGFLFSGDGGKIILSNRDNNAVYQYSSGTTTSTNRMDATQLNTVSDANHYTLGNDLDLAITLTMPDGNTSSPTSDGVSINYDANALNQSAIPGTDYDYDFPSNDTVRFTALSNENFKIRVA